jgi:Spy/CpxP family protein refolding chaperone
MKRGKLLTTVCILALSVSVALTAQAGPFGGGPNGHGPECGFHPMRALMQLDLSVDQKHAVYDILQKYEKDQEKAWDSVQERRQQMATQMRADEVNEAAIRQTFQETSAAREYAVVLRARMFAEIRSVLNDEQREQLAEMQQNRGERMAHRQKQRQFKRAVLKTWLQMDSD